MNREELRELVNEMRTLGVTRFQDGPVVIELAPAAPAPPAEPDPSKPEFTASLTDGPSQKYLEMLFKHSSQKPFRRVRHEK